MADRDLFSLPMNRLFLIPRILLTLTLLGLGPIALAQAPLPAVSQDAWRESGSTQNHLPPVSGWNASAQSPGATPGGTALSGGVWSNPFETPQTSWKSAGADARYQITRQERTNTEKHSGNHSEQITLAAQGGTFVYVAHDVGHPRVISELKAQVWVKSNRSGLQLLAKVILPRVRDPRTGRPVVTLVPGTSYNRPGQWQPLVVEDLPNAVKRNARTLRLQLRNEVDTREAYVEQVYLNLFGGPGTTQVWIDDLQLVGHVELPLVQTGPNDPRLRTPHASVAGQAPGTPPSTATAKPGNWSASAASTPKSSEPNRTDHPPRKVELIGPVLQIDKRPVLVRAIRYQGEPLSFLKKLGFNAVWLDQVPSRDLLVAIRESGLNVICPPPEAIRTAPESTVKGPHILPSPKIGPEYEPVIAWNLGWGLGEADVETTRQYSQKIRRADLQSNRPLICQPTDQLRELSCHVDLLMIDQAPLCSSIELSDYGTWLRSRKQLARPGKQIWATVQTETNLGILQQWSTMGRGLGSPPPELEYDQIRLAALTAITSCGRGLLFESRNPLTADDPQTLSRVRSLELVNRELELIEPFVAAGNEVDTVESSHPEVAGALFSYHRCRMLVPIWSGPGAQYVPGGTKGDQLSFVVPGIPESNRAYELVPGALRTVRLRSRVTGGIQVTLSDFSLSTLIVFTEDPQTLVSLRQLAQKSGPRMAKLLHEAAGERIARARRLDERLRSRPKDEWDAEENLVLAQKELQRCDGAVAAKDYPKVCLYAQRSMRAIRLLERSNWTKAIASAPSPVSSPATVGFATLPWHWSLIDHSRRWALGQNLVAGGDFDTIQTAMTGGWQHFWHETRRVQSRVDILPEASRSGPAGLRLAALWTDPSIPPTPIETPPVWVTSPPIHVEVGTLVRIHGWVHIPTPLTGSVDGLMIFDSMTGMALAERIGETTDWQSFTLYRIAPKSDTLTVTFALSGLGEVWLDDVTIQPLGPAIPTRPPSPAPGVGNPSSMSPPTATRPMAPIRSR